MGKEIVIDSLEDMCALMCDNVLPKEKPKEDPDRNKMYQAFECYANGGFPILCKKLGVDFADKSKNDRYTILHKYYTMLVQNDLMDI